jgi:hypothetical protein
VERSPQEQPLANRDTPTGLSALPHAWAPTHDVQFYVGEDNLATSVARFLGQGVRAGQPMVIIATAPHRAAFKEAMRALGIEPDDLVEGRDVVWLDARDTLSAFMEGPHPNAELFQATVGSVFEHLMRDRRYVIVRAYGEMVDILWRDGKPEAAIELEQLWNDLAAKYSFSLLCTYAVDSVIKGDCQGIDLICGKHSRVLPSEPGSAAA